MSVKIGQFWEIKDYYYILLDTILITRDFGLHELIRYVKKNYKSDFEINYKRRFIRIIEH